MTKKTIAWFAVLAAFTGCDGDGGTDAGMDDPDTGMAEVDAGMDAGMVTEDDGGMDAGMDAGPPATFTARLVNNIPDIAALDVCLWTEFGGAIIGDGIWLTDAPPAVPFRGVSSYLPAFSPDVDTLFALYDASTFSGECPADPEADDAEEAVVIGRAMAADVEADATYTVIASGFATGTLGAAEGALPSRCTPPTFDMPCTDASAARIIIVEDDLSAPGAGMVKIRVSNQVTNSSPLDFLVCYDPDLVPHSDVATRAQGGCQEPVPLSDPELIASVPFGQPTAYVEHTPIQPTIAAMGIGGGFYLAALPAGMACPAFASLPAAQQRCFPIVADAGRPASLPAEIQTNLTDGDILTFFIQGAIGVTEDTGTPPAEDYRVRFFPWMDNYVAPSP
jgi:hypothetical protein